MISRVSFWILGISTGMNGSCAKGEADYRVKSGGGDRRSRSHGPARCPPQATDRRVKNAHAFNRRAISGTMEGIPGQFP
jgi:hypothetical protein